MPDRAGLGRASCGIDLPLLRRGLGQHLACGGGGFAEWFPASLDTAAAAGAEALEIRARHCLHDLHPRPISAELVGQDHGQGGAHALAHFRFAEGKGEAALRVDPDPSVRLKVRGRGLRAEQASPVESDHERCAAEGGGFEKGAARSVHFAFSRMRAAARWIALRMRG